MINPLISIIVPVYSINYDLLKSCLVSLSQQDYEFAEFIIIDDGSPDDCGLICDEFASKDKRFKVLHVENSGVSAARNRGLSEACGDYVLFVDADDGLYPSFLSALARYLRKDESDIVFFNYSLSCTDGLDFLESHITDGSNKNLPDNLTLANSIVAHTDTTLGFPGIMFGSPWGKALKRSYLEKNSYRFPVGVKKTQDRIFMVNVLAGNPSMSYFDRLGYVYVEHGLSVCRKYNPDILNILGDAEQAFESVIRNNYEGKSLETLLDSLKYLHLNYFFSSLPISYFHKTGNKDYGHQKVQFVRVCNDFAYAFRACKINRMPTKQKKLLLLLLKTGRYGMIYNLLSFFYRRS